MASNWNVIMYVFKKVINQTLLQPRSNEAEKQSRSRSVLRSKGCYCRINNNLVEFNRFLGVCKRIMKSFLWWIQKNNESEFPPLLQPKTLWNGILNSNSTWFCHLEEIACTGTIAGYSFLGLREFKRKKEKQKKFAL